MRRSFSLPEWLLVSALFACLAVAVTVGVLVVDGFVVVVADEFGVGDRGDRGDRGDTFEAFEAFDEAFDKSPREAPCKPAAVPAPFVCTSTLNSLSFTTARVPINFTNSSVT